LVSEKGAAVYVVLSQPQEGLAQREVGDDDKACREPTDGAAEGRRIPPAATGSSCGLLRKQQNVLRRLTQIKYDHERHN
jgi:hypothetical protein